MVVVAVLAEGVVVAVLAEEVAVSAIPAEVPLHPGAVNPAVVQADLKEVAKVPLGAQAVAILVVDNLAVEALAVSTMPAEVPLHPKAVNPAVVQVGLEEVIKAEISEEEKQVLPKVVEQELVRVNVEMPDLAREKTGVVKLEKTVKTL